MTQQNARDFLFSLAFRGFIIHRPSAEHDGWFEHGPWQVRADNNTAIFLAELLRDEYGHYEPRD